MKSWQITAKEKLELISGSENISEGYAKVRITRAGICDTDIRQYKAPQKSYPIIPCRHATAVISEIGPDDFGLKQRRRRIFRPLCSLQRMYFLQKRRLRQLPEHEDLRHRRGRLFEGFYLDASAKH